MAFSTGGLSHGGASFMKSIIEAAVSAGWSRFDDISANASALAAARTVQSNTEPIEISVAGIATTQWIELPLMYLVMGSYSIRLNGGTLASPGTDYTIDEVRGRIRLVVGGLFDADSDNFGDAGATLTLDRGYQLYSGYTILRSRGSSGSDDIYLGVRFDSQSANAANPIRTGPRWAIFSSWSLGLSDFESSVISFRNAPADDVKQYIDAVADFTWQATVTLDRIISVGSSECYRSWCYAGQLVRPRPLVEQPRLTAMMGHNESTGPVADPSLTDKVGSGEPFGSVYCYDLGRFAQAGDSVSLNGNTWSFGGTAEDAAAGQGYTPSQVILNSPGVLGTPQYYFEIHEAICSRNANLIGDATNVIYGLWDGLYAVLCYAAKHGDQLRYNVDLYRVWGTGNSNRLIAVEEA